VAEQLLASQEDLSSMEPVIYFFKSIFIVLTVFLFLCADPPYNKPVQRYRILSCPDTL
jgi:hypothetical protein